MSNLVRDFDYISRKWTPVTITIIYGDTSILKGGYDLDPILMTQVLISNRVLKATQKTH